MVNYYQKFNEILKRDSGAKLLLQVCCAPCLSGTLKSIDKHFDISLYFYNPNIMDKDEYEKRLFEVKKYLKLTDRNYEVFDGGFCPEVFFEYAKGLQDIPEGGKRCFCCYENRLRRTAEFAKQNGYDYFGTTLTLSPYKRADKINEIGENLQNEIGVKYLYSDFKKNDGYKYSIEQSKIYGLYRQNYCGCIYSVR